ncbi:MAG: glycosyltransferase, partial [Candidatus Azobacteroides sp.]|nr:glycosyltransferase [Candidatus Azobacteroides sp.]
KTSNIELSGYQPFSVLKDYMQRAKAFVFAAEEDFGIVPVEAQACGTPVIAYGKGGVLESVIAEKTGIFFDTQSSDAIIDAINEFEKKIETFNFVDIQRNAKRFNKERFKNEFQQFVEKMVEKKVMM